MIKLIRAEFTNFRLLRDLELEFSTDSEKKLTVIRAANESGKTTILHGLQWAFYGDDALPGKGKDFRLHPIDWEEKNGVHVNITVTVDFELTKYDPISKGSREFNRRYRIVRSASEYINSKPPRSVSTMTLYEWNDTGSEPYPEPKALIDDVLPTELKGIFFTDGDRALSFIETEDGQTLMRHRVRDAIRSILGLSLIEEAEKHVNKVRVEVNKEAKQSSHDNELVETATNLEALEDKRKELEKDHESVSQQLSNVDEKIIEIDRKILEILSMGDKDKLRKELEDIRSQMEQIAGKNLEVSKDHSDLFRSHSIAIDLLTPAVNHVIAKLEKLHDQGHIPSMTIPVLQDRLETEICICGETLEDSQPGGAKRRSHIQKMINDSEKDDEVKNTITDLYFGTRQTSMSYRGRGANNNSWVARYKKIIKERDDLKNLKDSTGRKCRDLERQIESLPDTNIQDLRKTLRYYNEQHDNFVRLQTKYATQLLELNRICKELEHKRDELLRYQKKGSQILAKVDVIKDVLEVMEKTRKYITCKVLKEVSDSMNDIFLEMIGADVEQHAIIQRAEISNEFDIVVYGPKDRKLNPDRDLNGASRRALTLAFILALTKTSGVTAPNIIDTPLGMTSGYVRRSILKVAVRESTQLILFLTHDEITGCEDIIDQVGGVVVTLTNSSHYPKMLSNNPQIAEHKICRCECNHRKYCHLCQRRSKNVK